MRSACLSSDVVVGEADALISGALSDRATYAIIMTHLYYGNVLSAAAEVMSYALRHADGRESEELDVAILRLLWELRESRLKAGELEEPNDLAMLVRAIRSVPLKYRGKGGLPEDRGTDSGDSVPIVRTVGGHSRQFPDEVVEILRAAGKEGSVLTLPDMPPVLYKRVMEAVQLLGGSWDKKTKTHSFDVDAQECISKFLEGDGKLEDKKRKQQAFYTPDAVADKAASHLPLTAGGSRAVTDPSCGTGALLRAAARAGATILYGIDNDTEALDEARESLPEDVGLEEGDFLRMSLPPDFARGHILMNPPYSKNQWKKHVRHALEILRETGGATSCVAILPRNAECAEMAEEYGYVAKAVEHLPPGEFKDSGTNIATVITLFSPKEGESNGD